MGAITSNLGRDLERAPDPPVATGLPRWIAAVVLVFSAVLFYAFATHGTFKPFYQQLGPSFADDFFSAQAHSMVHGHLTVNPAQVPGECWVYKGRCYGYFGLTPSVLRLPLLPLLPVTDEPLTALYLTVSLSLAVGASLAIIYMVLARIRRTRMLTFLGFAIAFGLGPAGVLLMLARPAMYEESIAWAAAFGLLGMYCFLRWWAERRWGWAAALGVCMVLGANARPTAVPVAIVLGAGMILGSLNSYFRSRSDRTPSDNDGLHPPQPDRGLPWRGILLGLAVAIVPLVTSCGVYWLKFHALIPSTLLDQQVSGPGASSYWLALRRVDHNSLAGLRFIPTDLLAYLRPDGLRLHSGLPFIDFRLGVTAGVQYVGIPPGSILAEPWSTVPDEMPLAVILVLAAGVYWARRQLGRGLRLRPALWALLASPMAYCIAAGLGACVVTLTQCGITGRYLGDGVPLIVILVAASARVLGPAIASLSGRRATVLVAGVTVLLVASLLINVGLEYQDWWHTVP